METAYSSVEVIELGKNISKFAARNKEAPPHGGLSGEESSSLCKTNKDEPAFADPSCFVVLLLV
jgi:hypothetical protein